MLEVRLRSGTVVAFDGRVLEVFGEGESSRRLHIAQLSAPEAAESADGARTLVFEDGSVTLAFAREEAPGCARLLAAIAEARSALERHNSP
jgi:hypothetical protein